MDCRLTYVKDFTESFLGVSFLVHLQNFISRVIRKAAALNPFDVSSSKGESRINTGWYSSWFVQRKVILEKSLINPPVWGKLAITLKLSPEIV